MEKKKIMRIICAVLFVVGILGYGYKMYDAVHSCLSGVVVIAFTLQLFLCCCNVLSFKFVFEHILSACFTIILGSFAAIFTGACMVHSYWAVVYIAIPTILSLLSPILYLSKWKVSVWQPILTFTFLLVAIFLWNYLEDSPNYFNSYVSLQIFAVAIAMQWLPEKE